MLQNRYTPTLPQIQSGFDLISLSGDAPKEDVIPVSHGLSSVSHGSVNPGNDVSGSDTSSCSTCTAVGVSGQPPPMPPSIPESAVESSHLEAPLQISRSKVRLTSDAGFFISPPNSFGPASGRSFDASFPPTSTRTSTCTSVASSYQLYGEPSQTLIFLDWDDTLFPTSQLFDRNGIDKRGTDCPEELDLSLRGWREALQHFLSHALVNSDMCVIVTNSRRPWVDTCIDRFVPELRTFWNQHKGRLQVVYADECNRATTVDVVAVSSHTRSSKASLFPNCVCSAVAGLWTLLHNAWDNSDADEEIKDYDAVARELTAAKRVAMEQTAVQFYSRYHGQTWKNVLSIGDMPYEHEAVRDLAEGRKATILQRAQQKIQSVRVARRRQERLRIKTVIVPGAPTLEELTLNLHLTKRLLPAFVRYDGDVDVDLRDVSDPMHAIANAINIPPLAEVRLPWPSGEDCEEHLSEDKALDDIELIVQVAVQAWIQELNEIQRVRSR